MLMRSGEETGEWIDTVGVYKQKWILWEFMVLGC